MFLETLILTHFKNYEAQRIDCSPALNCFTGNNGMGKTNLLDAVYYLCMGKSHFNLVDSHLIQHGADFFRLEGIFSLNDRRERIVAKVAPRRRKEFERNGVPYQRLSDHVGLLPVVFIAPDDTLLIMEGSEARRNFLDNTLCQFNAVYLQHLIQYNKVLRQRNALLKQMAETQRFQPALLEVYDQQLLEPAQYIHRQRQAFTQEFRPLLLQTIRTLSGAQEIVDCQYQSKLSGQAMGDLLCEAVEKDRILERTTVGIHRDDLDFTIDGHPLKKFGSQGQLKTYLLGLKLAQYHLLRREKGIAPLLLLDDIFDKLDHRRVLHLIGMLLEQDFGQVFLTDTQPERILEIIRHYGADNRTFRVTDGTVALQAAE